MPADEGFEDLKVERWGRYRGEPSTEQPIRFLGRGRSEQPVTLAIARPS